METNPAPGPGDSVVSPSQDPGNDTLVSDPAERGTPRAALIDALFSQDVARCRELLDTHPELISTPLRQQAYNRIHQRDSAWGFTEEAMLQDMMPVVFASLVPRFREPDWDSRALSPAGLAIIVLLVERGAVLERFPMHKYWASHLLTEVCRDYDSPEALDLLVRIGADIYTRQLDDFHRTLLQVAAGRGAIGTVRFLLDRGVPMNYTNDLYGRHDTVNGTPLNWAAENGRSEVVRLLLSRGALSDIETLDWNGRTPLLCAARSAHVPRLPDLDREETIRLLVDAGADLKATDRPDLSWSFVFGERDPFPDSPLGHVMRWGSADIVRYLVGKGSDIHQQQSYPTDKCFPYGVGGDKATPLHRAAHNWNAAAVQALLDLGADPDATDKHGRQPIHWAAIGRCLGWHSPRIISYAWNDLQTDIERSAALSERLAALESTISHLISHSASADRPDAFGRTPLHYAAYMKQAGAVALLLQHGADPALPDIDGRTPLHHLADPLHRPHTSHDLADATVDDDHLASTLTNHLQRTNNRDIVNHRDTTGFTALHLAARPASAPAVALLLALGADPNLTLPASDVPEESGATALHLAAYRPSWVYLYTYEEKVLAVWSARAAKMKALLLQAGADAGVRDVQGRTAGEIEDGVREEIRRGREKYLEWLARPIDPELLGRGRGKRPGWGSGRGRGFGRGRPHGSGPAAGSGPGPASGPAPGPAGDGGVDMAAGAGHGRGSGERAA
ncbi:ankyrin [Parachaetomium inaequale]|uniref:protein S-acyltransferase n=1 Tax=Parachaetomium inaequale TaxID=2588326 RepID=A0AAN6PDI0_9PEZI|nr:ankyrin [Parachaetomium inaequale]